MTIRHAAAVFGVLAGAALVAPAQEPAPKTDQSPQAAAMAAAAAVARGATIANVVPAPFRMQLVVDNRFKVPVKNASGTETPDPRNRTDKTHCLVCEYGLSPVIAVFVRSDLKGTDPGSGLGKLIKGADALVPKYRSDKMAAFVAYLKLEGGSKVVTVKAADGSDEKVEAPKEYPDDEKRKVYQDEVRAFATALATDNVPFGLAPTTSPSITAFGLAESTPITIILYNRLRMAQRWDLKPDEITDEKIAEILTAAEEMVVGKKK